MTNKITKANISIGIGWFAKIFSVIIGLINTRLLIELADIDGYALFAVLLSLGGWINLFNLGIPSSIQNIIAHRKVNGKNIKIITSSVLGIIALLFIMLLPIFYLIAILLSKYILNDYMDIIGVNTVFFILLSFLFFAFSQIFYKILYATDRSIFPNIYPLVISVINLLMLFILKLYNVDSINTILICFFSSNILIFSVSYLQSLGFCLPNFNYRIAKVMLFRSRKFFLFSLLATLALGFDYIIMAQILDSLEITKYNLTMKVFSLVLFMYTTVLATSWSTSSESYYKQKFHKILEILYKNIKIGMLLLIFVTIFVLSFKNEIFNLISGKENLIISYNLLLVAFVYIAIRIWTDTFSMILSSINKIDINIYILPIQIIIGVMGQYYFGTLYGTVGIFIGLILGYLLSVSIVLPIYLYKELKI